jgi:PKD repeat protein
VYQVSHAGAVRDDRHVLLAFDDAWDEDTLVIPLAEAYARHGNAVVSTAVSAPEGGRWYSFDCTGYARAQLAGDGVISVALDLDTTGTVGGVITWASKEYQGGRFAPRLVLAFADEDVGSVTADFAVEGARGYDPLPVRFVDRSTAFRTDVVAWHWDFGDGETSNEPEPVHVYATPGEYTITLTVFGANGDSHTLERPGLISVADRVIYSESFTGGVPGAALSPPWQARMDGASWTTGAVYTPAGLDFPGLATRGLAAGFPQQTESSTAAGTFALDIAPGDFQTVTFYLSFLVRPTVSPADGWGSQPVCVSVYPTINSGNSTAGFWLGIVQNLRANDPDRNREFFAAGLNARPDYDFSSAQVFPFIDAGPIVSGETYWVVARFRVRNGATNAEWVTVDASFYRSGDALPVDEPLLWDASAEGPVFWPLGSAHLTLDAVTVHRDNTSNTADVDEIRLAARWAGVTDGFE